MGRVFVVNDQVIAVKIPKSRALDMNKLTSHCFQGLVIIMCCYVAGCAASSPKASSAELVLEVRCEEPRPQICTQEYVPVCGLRDTGIRCITTPCDSTEWKTYSNACVACGDLAVFGYRQNQCPNEQDQSG